MNMSMNAISDRTIAECNDAKRLDMGETFAFFFLQFVRAKDLSIKDL